MEIAGLKVDDASKPLTIHITKRDIDKGDTKDAASCAAAQALMRETSCTQARVHIARTYLQIGKKWVRYRTPVSLRAEIIAFDRGGKFEPGEYRLEAIQPVLREGGKWRKRYRAAKAPGSRPNTSASMKKRKYHVVGGVRARGANR